MISFRAVEQGQLYPEQELLRAPQQERSPSEAVRRKQALHSGRSVINISSSPSLRQEVHTMCSLPAYPITAPANWGLALPMSADQGLEFTGHTNYKSLTQGALQESTGDVQGTSIAVCPERDGIVWNLVTLGQDLEHRYST